VDQVFLPESFSQLVLELAEFYMTGYYMDEAILDRDRLTSAGE
jgi:hypothetical protein